MPNRQKQKGDRAERAVRDYLQQLGYTAQKTRAGFNDDLGDVILHTTQGLIAIQVKDCAQANWRTWFEQLDQQVQTLKASTTQPVLGGVLVWKTRGSANPANWRTIIQLQHLTDLIGDQP